jgi:hypothetical protein
MGDNISGRFASMFKAAASAAYDKVENVVSGLEEKHAENLAIHGDRPAEHVDDNGNAEFIIDDEGTRTYKNSKPPIDLGPAEVTIIRD